MENQSAVLIPLLTDATIQATGGSATRVIGPALNFIHRARSLQAFIETYEIGGATPTLDVEAEWSIDKVNWMPFTGPVSGATPVSSAGMFAAPAYTTSGDFGPFVRFIVSFASASGDIYNGTIVLNVRFFG